MISVCMATYNGAKYIKEQIDSILPQIGSGDEIVVSDDGSTDGTIEILKSYNDTRIKILHHHKDGYNKLVNHQKVTRNFENAIKNSSGDWIFLSDQDDIWAPNKVAICSQYFSSHDLIVSDCCFIRDGIVDLNTSKLKERDLRWSIIGIPPNYHGCCICFNAKYKSLILPFPKRLYIHDAWIGHLIRWRGREVILKDKLVYYRFHPTNVSRGKNRDIFYTLKHRLLTIAQLLSRVFK